MTDGYQVRARHERFQGPIFSVVTDEVAMPGGGTAARDYVIHVGAVAVAAVDRQERLVMVRQYRHPVGRVLWELPAGLIDVEGEELRAAAARELAEEADLSAARWQVLIDLFSSPGFTTEAIRIYLARELTEVPEAQRHTREHEEAGITVHRVPLDEAVRMVFAGQVTNATAVAGILGAARLRDSGWPAPERPLDSPLVRALRADG